MPNTQNVQALTKKVLELQKSLDLANSELERTKNRETQWRALEEKLYEKGDVDDENVRRQISDLRIRIDLASRCYSKIEAAITEGKLELLEASHALARELHPIFAARYSDLVKAGAAALAPYNPSDAQSTLEGKAAHMEICVAAQVQRDVVANMIAEGRYADDGPRVAQMVLVLAAKVSKT